jgi:hypothetical protein
MKWPGLKYPPTEKEIPNEEIRNHKPLFSSLGADKMTPRPKETARPTSTLTKRDIVRKTKGT